MIEVSALTAGYGKKQVISRFSFSMDQSQSPLVLAGPNGCGKSTLLRCLLGEIPYQGKIDLPFSEKRIAWLPQGYRLSLSIPVVDFVAIACLDPGKPWAQIGEMEKEKAFAELTDLEMAHLARQKTDEVSGGEWQMICLAQMAMQNTDFWLLDEPTAHLDLYFKELVFTYLWKKAKAGKWIILSTHDIPFLPESGGYFLMMNAPEKSFPLNSQTKERVIQELKSKKN